MHAVTDERPLAYSIACYEHLQSDLCNLIGFQKGEIETRSFPDGETYHRICDIVGGREVILIGGTVSEAATLELYDLACALVKYDAKRLTLIIPYFGYSTMERAVRPGEVVAAKTRARLLSSIPPASFGNRVFLLDLHSEGIPEYFEGGLTAIHVRGKQFVADAAKRLFGHDFVLACTDAGRAKWVESLANDLRVQASFVYKRRMDDNHTVVTAVSAQVEGRNVIVYDDMIRTGGSLLQAAKAYNAAGAAKLAAITTHGLFPGDALERLRQSGLFSKIICTDSHPRALELKDDFLEVHPVAELFAPHIA